MRFLRQAVYGRVAGYEDTNDAERLRVDPAMRHVVGGRAEKTLGASTGEMGCFETDLLGEKENIRALSELSGAWTDRLYERTGSGKLTLDLDGAESPTYGDQEGSAYNGHFGCTCYHPLFCFNQFGDLEGAMLREGNVHSAHDWRKLLSRSWPGTGIGSTRSSSGEMRHSQALRFAGFWKTKAASTLYD